MNQPQDEEPSSTVPFLILESLPGFIGAGAGWLLNIKVFQLLQIERSALVESLLFTIPLLLFFVLFVKLPLRSFTDIRNILLEYLESFLIKLDVLDILLLSLLAGLSEEIFFRGFLQTWLNQIGGDIVALLFVSLIFGLLHAVTKVYALLVALISMYLGYLFIYTENLLHPIVAHSVYDAVAFYYLSCKAKKISAMRNLNR